MSDTPAATPAATPAEPAPAEPTPAEPIPAEPTPAEPAPAEPAPTPAKTPDWREGIENEKVREWAVKQLNSPADAAVEAFNLRQKLSNSVQIPGEDATDEQVAAYRKRLGIPDEAEDYQLEWDEGIELTEPMQNQLLAFGKAMHAKHAPTEMVQTAVDFYLDMIKATMEAEETRAKDDHQAAEATLRQEWSTDYDKNVRAAQTTISELAKHYNGRPEDLLDLKMEDGNLLGNHPEFLKMLSTVGRRIMPDGVITETRMTDAEATDAKTKVDDLTRQMMDARDKGDMLLAERINKEIFAIQDKRLGDQPIVGREGRAI